MGKIIKLIINYLNNGLENLFGVKILRTHRDMSLVEDIPHRRLFPLATYSPWLADSRFHRVYEVAKNYTLIDEYRLYELYQLAKQCVTCGGAFLEVGVWRGGSSAVIQAALSEQVKSGESPDFYIADTFMGVVKAGSAKDTTYKGGEHSDTSAAYVEALFKKLDLKKPEILVGIFPDDHTHLNIEKISFVHADADAYESTRGVIEWCLPRLTRGAMIVLDDYGFLGCEGVTRYVNEFMEENQDIFLMFYNINGHAILLRK